MWISGKPAAVVKANRDSNPKHGDLDQTSPRQYCFVDSTTYLFNSFSLNSKNKTADREKRSTQGLSTDAANVIPKTASYIFISCSRV